MATRPESMNKFTSPYVSPSRNLLYFIIFSVILWSLQNAILRPLLPMDALESVCWGGKLQWGYYKHPPLAAWLAFLTARVTGYQVWAQYLLHQMCIGVGGWFVYKLGRLYFNELYASLGTLLLYFCHYFSPSAMVICPNSIQFLLQPIIAYYYVCAMKSNSWKAWLILGVSSGLAFLGKYSVGMLLFAMFIASLMIPAWRKRLVTIGPWVAGGIFILVVLPHLIWLFGHDYTCLKYVSDSINDNPPANRFFLPFLVVVTTFYPLLLFLAILLLSSFRKPLNPPVFRRSNEFLPYAIAISFIPCLIVFIISVSGHEIVITWLSTMASWMGLLAIEIYPYKITQQMFKRIQWLLLIVVSCSLIGTSFDLLFRTRNRVHLSVESLNQQITEFWKAHSDGKLACVVGDRRFANALEFYHKDHPDSYDFNDRANLNRIPVGSEILLVARTEDIFARVVEKLQISPAMQPVKIEVPCAAFWGKEKKQTIYLGYISPESVNPNP